jgi:hypothetical protein
VITTEWDVVLRPDDGETVGYLMPEGDLVVPLTLVGTPLGAAQTHAEATALLLARGLGALDGRWWCRLPDVLPGGVLPAAEPASGWGWRPVVLVEVSPTGCRVRPEWPAPEELAGQAALPVPVGGLLRVEPPA